MKAQTSIEFVLLLAAVAGLSVVVLSQYGSIKGAERTAYSAITNASTIQPPNTLYTGSQGPSLSIYAPQAMYVNSTYKGDVLIVYQSGYMPVSVYFGNSNATAISPAKYPNITPSGLDLLPFYVSPHVTGAVNITAYATFLYQGQTVIREASASASVSQMPTSSQSGYTFISIQRHNETDLYSVGAWQNVSGFSYSSHCANYNFWGTMFPESGQCGPNSWGVAVGDSNCNPFWYDGSTRYYCFYTNTTRGKVGSTNSLLQKFNMTLLLTYGQQTLSANLSSTKPKAPLVGQSGEVYGNATAQAVNCGSSNAGYQVLENSNAYHYVNSTLFSEYKSASAALVQTLVIYNGSGGNNVIQYVLAMISEINTMVNSIASSSAESAGNCTIAIGSQIYEVCKPGSVFSYNITANVVGEQPISYGGYC
jgi:hypothetical protein